MNSLFVCRTQAWIIGLAVLAFSALAVPAIVWQKSHPKQEHHRNQEHKMNKDEIIAALRAHDRAALEQVTDAPTDLADALARALATLDTEAREMTVSLLVRTQPLHTGELLLRLAQDTQA